MSKYKIYYNNAETKKTETVTVKAAGIVPAIKHIGLLGWDIVKIKKI